jgi:AraC family transcriptional regulator of adaptative response / DNA-3-methyladenine glycosylase II
MPLTRGFMLARAAARDPDYDGVFLTCVRTTGIYCLPSCRARTPRPENVEHAPDPATARARGYRPCQRCRPDDRYAGRDRDRDALLAAVTAVRARPGDFRDVAAFAAAAGCGQTKLLLSCRRHLHRPPAEVLLLARLERARAALATTRARVLDVALDSGFEGSSAFHANFRRHHGMSPRAYRTMLAGASFALSLPDDHATAPCLLHQVRGESASERGGARELHLALQLGGRAGILSLQHRGRHVRAEVRVQGGSVPGRAAMVDAHAAAVRILRLDCDPLPAVRALQRDAALRPSVRAARGLRPWATPTAIDCLWLAILGQQVNVAFAFALRAGLALRAGTRIGDLCTQPDAAAVAALDARDLVRMRCSRGKAEALLTAARAVASGGLDVEDLATGSAEVAAERLQSLRGIGPWTAQYVLLRGARFLDCLPAGDAALSAAAQRAWSLPERPDAATVSALTANFAPHRSWLAFHLWRWLAAGSDSRARTRTTPARAAALLT